MRRVIMLLLPKIELVLAIPRGRMLALHVAAVPVSGLLLGDARRMGEARISGHRQMPEEVTATNGIITVQAAAVCCAIDESIISGIRWPLYDGDNRWRLASRLIGR